MNKADAQLVRKVYRNIREHGLFECGPRIVAAVSGGADSMAMLAILDELKPVLGLKITVAHLNHHIRGRSADEDAAFVARFAGQMRIPVVTGSAYVKKIARREGVSIEMAARKARYRFLGKTMRNTGGSCVVTAHTADDQVENVILRLSRGAGFSGLSGMQWKSEAMGYPVAKPLLNIYKSALVSFLRNRNIEWREDASNEDTTIARNHVRHEIIPSIESTLNPSFKAAVLRSLNIVGEEDRWMDGIAADLLSQCAGTSAASEKPRLSVRCLRELPLPAVRRIIRQWIPASGGEFADFVTIERICRLINARKGTGIIPLAGKKQVVRNYDDLTIEEKPSPQSEKGDSTFCTGKIAVPGKTELPELGVSVRARLQPGLITDTYSQTGSLRASATISASRLGARSLIVRTWKPGDRIEPVGMSGSRKLQDIFVDQKIPPLRRKNIPLLVCNGEIVWLPGYSVSRNWTVKDQSQTNIHLQLVPI